MKVSYLRTVIMTIVMGFSSVSLSANLCGGPKRVDKAGTASVLGFQGQLFRVRFDQAGADKQGVNHRIVLRTASGNSIVNVGIGGSVSTTGFGLDGGVFVSGRIVVFDKLNQIPGGAFRAELETFDGCGNYARTNLGTFSVPSAIGDVTAPVISSITMKRAGVFQVKVKDESSGMSHLEYFRDGVPLLSPVLNQNYSSNQIFSFQECQVGWSSSGTFANYHETHAMTWCSATGSNALFSDFGFNQIHDNQMHLYEVRAYDNAGNFSTASLLAE